MVTPSEFEKRVKTTEPAVRSPRRSGQNKKKNTKKWCVVGLPLVLPLPTTNISCCASSSCALRAQLYLPLFLFVYDVVRFALQSAKAATAAAGKGAKAAAPAVAKKVQAAPVKKPVKSIVNAALIRKVDPKNLVWPAHATHLFIDASPSIFQLPLTRRLHSTMKLRARAQELFMMIAFDFHHKMPALKSTTVVWDHTPEVCHWSHDGQRTPG
jgi:hypothetical protein